MKEVIIFVLGAGVGYLLRSAAQLVLNAKMIKILDEVLSKLKEGKNE